MAARERRAGCVAGAPDRTRAPSLMLLVAMQCCWHGWCVDGHACGAVRPSQGAGGSRVRAGARLERSRVAQWSARSEKTALRNDVAKGCNVQVALRVTLSSYSKKDHYFSDVPGLLAF